MPKPPEPAPAGPLSADASARMMDAAYAGDLVELVQRANRDYLYWDKFKHLPMPAEVRVEDAWRFLKLLRSFDRKTTPVTDVHGHHFTYSLTDEIQRCLHVIDKEAGGPVTGAGIGVPRHEQQRYVISSLMEEAIASSQIEGAATTRQIAKDMLRSQKRPSTIPERMILNNYRTIAALRDAKGEFITPELIVGIQASLTEGTLQNDGDVGRLRESDDILVQDSATARVLHVPPPAAEIPAEVRRLCAYANQEGGAFEHPVLKGTILHFWLAYLHPFADGNGRTARALFYLYMLKRGYWLFEYLSISRVILHSRSRYDRAYLYAEADDADMTYFVTFHLHAIEKSLQALWAYLERKRDEEGTLVRALAHDRTLNHRQRAVLSRALTDPNIVFTIESHRASHDVAYPTARADLLELAGRGYLTQRREGRAFVFRPAENIRERLSPRPPTAPGT